MTSPGETAIDQQMAAPDDQDMRERTPDPAGPPRAGDPQPPPGGARHPGATAAGSPAGEPEAVGPDDGERSMTPTVPGAEPEPVPESPAVSGTATMSTRWHEIQAMFVDDPRASAEMAASLVDDSIRALVASVKERQDSLRTAVQHYRAFGTHLADFSRET